MGNKQVFKVGDAVTFRHSDKKPKLTIVKYTYRGTYIAESVDGVRVICKPRELRLYDDV